jgi:hypothetical protein
VVHADKGLTQAPPAPRAQTSPAEVGEYDDFFEETYPLLVKTALAAGADSPRR